LDWSHLAFELTSKTWYWSEDRGNDKVTGRRGRRSKQLLYDLKKQRVLPTERGSIRQHFVEKSPCKRLWACRKQTTREWSNYTTSEPYCSLNNTSTTKRFQTKGLTYALMNCTL